MDWTTFRTSSEPDFSRIETVLRRTGEPDRVPFFELFSQIQPEVLRTIGLPLIADWADEGPERVEQELTQHITYMVSLGYDYINAGARQFRFPQKDRPRAMTAEGERSYLKGDTCTIASWEDFNTYPWPEVSEANFSPLEIAPSLIPDGMKVIPIGPGGVLENAMWLLGYEGISYALYDDEPLVRATFDAVGSRLVALFNELASFDVVGAVALGDDLGFRTQTLVSPAVCREYVFPWHKKIVDAAHRHGKPAILHACGNLSEVMEDILDCGWDGRHSFEDAIQPVWEIKVEYGDRIALLGGFDVDKICRMGEEEFRAHTRMMIEKCAQGGGWALGTGNSVANYVPTESFLAMIDEGHKAGRYGGN